MTAGQYPHVRVEGEPLERGRQYGEQARERMLRSRDAYEEVFDHVASWSWGKVTQEAGRYVPAIRAFRPEYLDEMHGMASGSGLRFEDVLALNVRSEVMFAAKARHALSHPIPGVGECTAFAALPEGPGGQVLVGQNWDWLMHSFDTVVVLEAVQIGKPAYVTVVEAGLLAKLGMNSAGIGLVTNALVTDLDRGEPGIPFHVLLRSVLDAETVTDALGGLQAGFRSSSANYVLASAEGVALDVEAAPGDFRRLRVAAPEDGLLLHTNHLLHAQPGVTDVSLWAMPDSAVRLQRARHVAGRSDRSRAALTAMLSDHADRPWSICAHPDERLPRLDQAATVASAVMDLGERRMWLADGQPCRTPYRELDYGAFLAARDETAAARRGPDSRAQDEET
jgi:isopenicillin-N N-acyltransferase-like protein